MKNKRKGENESDRRSEAGWDEQTHHQLPPSPHLRFRLPLLLYF